MSEPDAGVPAIDGIRVGVGGWTFEPWRDTFYPLSSLRDNRV